MLLSAPVSSSNLSLSLQSTLCFMYAALTLTLTHTAADALLCTLGFFLLRGINCLKHTVLFHGCYDIF